MKLLLLSPSHKFVKKVLKAIKIPQLALHILASLTPNDVDITVIDEEIREIDFSLDFDLVGISCMTATANRSYQLSDMYRERGSKVVLGGIHPTILPQEAIQHADAVVIGEAEGCWADVIDDFKKGRLQKFYHVPEPDLSKFPFPRRDFHIDKALFNCVGLVTTRGCPYACEFCSVTDFYGRKIRHRPVSMVVEDIKRSGSKTFLILDDNVTGHPEYSKTLFEALIPLGIGWVGQSSISLAKDKEMLKLCRLSGCAALFFGLESVSPSSLMGMRKSLKSIEETEEAIKSIQDNGIAFHPSIILGFDTDTKAIFDDTLKFLTRTKLPTMALHVLTPYPGTRIYQRFKGQGRIISLDWSHYDHNTVVFQPKNMTPQELAEGHHYVQSEFYSFSSIVRHIPFLLRVSPINIRRVVLLLLLNIAGKNVAKYIDTSLDWADNNEKWNSQEIRPDEKVFEGSTVFSLDQAHLPFLSLKEGSPIGEKGRGLNRRFR
ncbi:MAG: radical SAM protein [Deltaproteobacteria bacterium]